MLLVLRWCDLKVGSSQRLEKGSRKQKKKNRSPPRVFPLQFIVTALTLNANCFQHWHQTTALVLLKYFLMVLVIQAIIWTPKNLSCFRQIWKTLIMSLTERNLITLIFNMRTPSCGCLHRIIVNTSAGILADFRIAWNFLRPLNFDLRNEVSEVDLNSDERMT